jgi:transposase
MVQAEMQMDPFSGSLYLFSNKTRKLLKLLYWDRKGFCLWQKRLACISHKSIAEAVR